MHTASQSFCCSSGLFSASSVTSSFLHNASALHRSCLCSRPVENAGSRSVADHKGGRTIVRCCRDSHDEEAGSTNWVSSGARHARSFWASVAGFLPLISMTNARVSESNPNLLAQVNHHKSSIQAANDANETLHLVEELDVSAIPKHIAIIMDGNERWARRRRMPASMGYIAGAKSLHEVIKLGNTLGVEVLTVFAFSTENWLRPKMEVDFLMLLFEKYIKDELSFLTKENVQVHFIGDLTLLPDSLRSTLEAVEKHTKYHTGLKLCIALNYGGRQDIVNACQRLAAKVEVGDLNSWDITESTIEEVLRTGWLGDARDPDLLIRTSGEQRLSNFLLWQTAYTELYFVASLWPDFGARHFKNALIAYQHRNRRFGKRD